MDIEEIRTDVIWDTSGVKAGADDIEKIVARQQRIEAAALSATEARQKAHQARMAGLRSAHDGRAGNSRMTGDLLNAATGSSGNVNRVNMLQHLGFSAATGGAVAAGIGAATGILNRYREEAKELQRTSDRLDESFASTRGRAAYMNAGSGRGSLSGSIEDLRKAGLAEADHQGGLIQTRKDRDYFFGAGGPGPARLDEGLHHLSIPGLRSLGELNLTGGDSINEQLAKSRQREGTANSLRQKLENDRSEGIRKDTAFSRERTRGSSFQAERLELQMSEKREIAEAGAEQISRKDLANIRARFDIERREIDVRERTSKLELNTRQEIADFRGGPMDREQFAANRELDLARKSLELAKSRTKEEQAQARVRVAAAEQAVTLTNLEAAARRDMWKGEVEANNVRQQGLGFRAGLAKDRFGPEENKKFAAGQAVQRREAEDNLVVAQGALDRVNNKATREFSKNGAVTPETKHEQTLFMQARDAAQTEKQEKETQLAEEEKARNIQIERARNAGGNETAAMRLDNKGRGDLAERRRDEDQTKAQAEELRRQGRPELAAELEKQHALREQSRHDQIFLLPNGRRRPRADIMHDLRSRRRTERRFDAAHARAAGSGDPRGAGLHSGDPTSRHNGNGLDIPPGNVGQDPKGPGLHPQHLTGTGPRAVQSNVFKRPWYNPTGRDEDQDFNLWDDLQKKRDLRWGKEKGSGVSSSSSLYQRPDPDQIASRKTSDSGKGGPAEQLKVLQEMKNELKAVIMEQTKVLRGGLPNGTTP
jgi:hypothetical protein